MGKKALKSGLGTMHVALKRKHKTFTFLVPVCNSNCTLL